MLHRFYRLLVGQHGLEECFYIDFAETPTIEQLKRITWLIANPSEEITTESRQRGPVIEVGPRLSVETPFSSNATSIFNWMNIPVTRIECSTRYPEGVEPKIDPLTQEIYPEPLSAFPSGHIVEPVRSIDVLGGGMEALADVNRSLGLGMDESDLDYYLSLFRRLGRNPTDVELFQLGNGNSEHSRHHFFGGIQIIDGVEMPKSLMDIVKAPWKANPGNSLVAFHDNSGVIYGTKVQLLVPDSSIGASAFGVRYDVLQHITATAETHNHPTLIAPFPGANTGAGGRIRDSRAVGRGALVHAGIAGYCVGNLHLPDFLIPGEKVGGEINTQASPLQILMRGSDGVSDYGNKIGEPLLGGFTRSFGLMVDGARREFRKPVLYSGGFGRIDAIQLKKREPEKGMLIVRIGGPAYRIGVGGGSASSMTQGTNSAALDLKSVQRGNPEMENRVNRVIQACAEMREKNPIESIHDQGAGGPSNVLTELLEPVGGSIDIRRITLGDQTMSVLEIWVAEYQEGYGLLVRLDNLELFQEICERERVNCEVVGEITGNGKVIVEDSADETTPVNLDITDIMSKVPRKRFRSDRRRTELQPLLIPEGLTVEDALRMVFRLPQVGSKGFLVRKVDRSVTGLVVRQQCCGPMQIPVSDAAVTADSYFGNTGAVAAIGEQPNKMLVNSAAGGRMAVAEMFTNMAGVCVSSIPDITCRANWMWAAKLPGEGALLYDAAMAMRDFMLQMRIKIDGGKDSLSMATKVGDTNVVSPGELVIMGYAPVPDITKVATPDFKGSGCIMLIDFGRGKNRLGGSSLAQALGQIGNESPDIDDVSEFGRAFTAMQELIREGLITAYHDRSDGGLITTVAEMCMAGNCGANIRIRSRTSLIPWLFNEEAGMVFECPTVDADEVMRVLNRHDILPQLIGTTDEWSKELTIACEGKVEFKQPLTELRKWWEATSTELELLQANPETVRQEWASFSDGKAIPYHLSFTPKLTHVAGGRKPRVAIVREEGTNGDREMVAACITAGLEPWDISMNDILSGEVDTFDSFKGIIFPGGFSYADVFGSAKGWAGPILFNKAVREMFDRFYHRKDTFSLGVCNGCQLMANIGWLPYRDIPEEAQPRFAHNTSGRFESRWVGVKVLPSPAVLLRGMEGSILGVHVAHGEGRLSFPDPSIAGDIWKRHLVPLVYVDTKGNSTEAYPYNPNGSPEGWTALCSPDGRHLAMMPHPERCFLKWQLPHLPEQWKEAEAAPWLQLFQNARSFCDEHV